MRPWPCECTSQFRMVTSPGKIKGNDPLSGWLPFEEHVPSHRLTWNLTWGFLEDQFPFRGKPCQVPCKLTVVADLAIKTWYENGLPKIMLDNFTGGGNYFWLGFSLPNRVLIVAHVGLVSTCQNKTRNAELVESSERAPPPAARTSRQKPRS